MRCSTDLRSRTPRHGLNLGQVNSRGLRHRSAFTSTPVTRRTMRSRTFCAAPGGERPMKQHKRQPGEIVESRRNPMRGKRIGTAVLGTLFLVVSSLPAFAHHAFGSEFDSNRPVLLKGKV